MERASTDANGGQAVAEGHLYGDYHWDFGGYYVWTGPEQDYMEWVDARDSGRQVSEWDTFYGASDAPVISANGRYVAFTSDAFNLVPGDAEPLEWNALYTNSSERGFEWVEVYRTDFHREVFVKDLLTGAIVRANTDAQGRPADPDPGDMWSQHFASWAPRLSADGRYVGFLSDASTLVANDRGWGTVDAFVKDLQTGALVRVGDADADEVVAAAGLEGVDWWTAG